MINDLTFCVRGVLFKHLVLEVDEIDFVGAAGDGGVEPAHVLFVEILFREITLVHQHVPPLAALRFVAGE